MNYAQRILVALAIKHNGDWNAICSDIRAKAEFKTDVESAYLAQADEILKEGKAITIVDEAYPSILRERTSQPPFVLFVKRGDVSAIDLNKKTSYVQKHMRMTDVACEVRDAIVAHIGELKGQICWFDANRHCIQVKDLEKGIQVSFVEVLEGFETVETDMRTRKDAVGLAEDAFYFDVRKRSKAIAEIALLLSRDVKDVYVLPTWGDPEDLSCKLIADGLLDMYSYLGGLAK